MKQIKLSTYSGDNMNNKYSVLSNNQVVEGHHPIGAMYPTPYGNREVVENGLWPEYEPDPLTMAEIAHNVQ